MPDLKNAPDKLLSTFKQEGEDLLCKLDKLEKDYELGLKQKLEDTAFRIRELGGVCEKAIFKCRKMEYFGDAGDIYFEQPSITLIESGLWSGASFLPRMSKIEIISRNEKFIDAIRFTYANYATDSPQPTIFNSIGVSLKNPSGLKIKQVSR